VTRLPYKYVFENFWVWDTVGLNEADEGTVSPEQAVEMLSNVFRSCMEGVALVIYVKRMGRSNPFDEANVKIIRTILPETKNFFTVITGCDSMEDDLSDDPIKWVRGNFVHFRTDLFGSLIGICSNGSRAYSSQRLTSMVMLSTHIQNYNLNLISIPNRSRFLEIMTEIIQFILPIIFRSTPAGVIDAMVGVAIGVIRHVITEFSRK